MYENYLSHHGILGQKWGVKNGPPYPLGGGDYTESEIKAIKKAKKSRNSIYNKKHFDTVLSKNGTVLSTLSYDKNRTTNSDMFYATWDFFDKHQYNALFNKKIDKEIFDENGNSLGHGSCFKFRIDNSLSKDMKVASEDSSAEIFRHLYRKDRDFYNFVTDHDRMQSYFVQSKFKFKGYREGRDVLDKMRKDVHYVPSSSDLQKVYRLFNYVIPYDGAGDLRKSGDVQKQRAKFFAACKEAGYGAVLDTNDAIYGSYKARSPVIVFDINAVVPKSVKETTVTDKLVSDAILVARKSLRL